MMVSTLFTALALAIVGIVPDTLVVCPPEYQEALEPWLDYRTAHGHHLEVVAPTDSSAALQATIADHAQSGRLQCVLLIGDVPGSEPSPTNASTIATHYRTAKVNVRFGSTATIATDAPYADVDGDGVSDLAIGRIPVDSATELSTVVEKIIRYELGVGRRGPPQQDFQKRSFQKRLEIVAGQGGFSPAIDRMIEVTARQMIHQIVPTDYQVGLTQLDTDDAADSRRQIREQLATPCAAWIFMGHGMPGGLFATSNGNRLEPFFSVQDIAAAPILGPSEGNPLAVLLACYAGAMDAKNDCLAEELLVQPGGPIAVIAASRVSMPYGNTVIGYELLKAYFSDQSETLGQCYLNAQRSAIAGDREEPLRKSFDQLARGMIPAPVDLVSERREHVQMYHLLGDPLLTIRPAKPVLQIAEAAEGEPLHR